jgi:acetyltransferase-like isoleucine patch superfamily enzyme
VAKPLRIIQPHYIKIGKDVSILHMARIECIRHREGEKYEGEVIIGDGTSIEQCCHIIAGSRLEIEKDVTISAYVYIADCGHSIEDVTKDVMDQPLEIKKTHIGEGAFIGIGAKIMPGVTIGKHAVVGANAVVSRDVPDYCMVAGVPARIIKKYDLEKKMWVKQA